jgi:hypothetical protein
MKKKLIFTALVAILAFAMIGCGGGDDDTPPPPTKYTVSFDVNGGTGTVPASQTVDKGKSITLPGGTGLSKPGYLFGGWSETADGTALSGTTYTPTKTIKLFAKWNADASATVTGVEVTGGDIVLAPGGTSTYTATVIGTGSFVNTVTWSVTGGTKAGTAIVAATGALTVASDEDTGITLVVTATSTVNADAKGTRNVNIVDPSELPTVTSVSISPTTATVEKPGTQQFTATVTGTNLGTDGLYEGVDWTVTGSNPNGASTIDHTGLLTVGANENATTLVVKAASQVDSEKYDTVDVTVTGHVVGPEMVTVTFNPNYPQGFTYTGPAIPSVEIEAGAVIGDKIAGEPAAPEGYVFNGWANATGSVTYTEESEISEDTIMYAQWILDELDVEDAYELLYLQNGGLAVYQFTLPAGKTLNDYDKVSASYKVSAAGLKAWDALPDRNIRYTRLYGVFTSLTPTTNTNPNQEPAVVYYNLSGRDSSGVAGNSGLLNNGYMLDNSVSASSIRTNAEANEWFDVTYSTTGSGKHDDYNLNNLQLSATGTVYYALGLSCQISNGNASAANQFVQAIKDIKLIPKSGSDSPVPGVKPVYSPASWLKPAYTPAQFLSNNAPIVMEWRGEPTQENYKNWKDLIPKQITVVGPEPFDRVPVPAIDTLDDYQLDVIDYSYVNRGNPLRQRGWASFTEAGRANDQSATVTSTTAFENFRDAWYLVLETTGLPTGTLSLVWMGGSGGWNSGNATTNSGGALTLDDGTVVSTIETVAGASEGDPDTYKITIFLPKVFSAASYENYFKNNAPWAALSFSYWGANLPNTTTAADLTHIGITKAYFLLETVTPDPVGIAAGLSFKLTDPPAGGAVIDDVVLDEDGEVLEVVAAPGLTEYRWYVDGKLTAGSNTLPVVVKADAVEADEDEGIEAEDAINITDLTVTLQAKRGGKWVSQTVFITVGN